MFSRIGEWWKRWRLQRLKIKASRMTKEQKEQHRQNAADIRACFEDVYQGILAAGDYFESKGLFDDAHECWRQYHLQCASDIESRFPADPYAGMAEAGRYLDEKGLHDEARNGYWSRFHLRKAEDIFRQEDDEDAGCQKAGEYLIANGMPDAGHHTYLKRIYLKKAREIGNQETGEEAKHARAAEFLEQMGVHYEASELYEQAGDLESALRVAEASGFEQRIHHLHMMRARCIYDETRESEKSKVRAAKASALYLEKKGFLDEAASFYRDCALFEDLRRVNEKMGKPAGSLENPESKGK